MSLVNMPAHFDVSLCPLFFPQKELPNPLCSTEQFKSCMNALALITRLIKHVLWLARRIRRSQSLRSVPQAVGDKKDPQSTSRSPTTHPPGIMLWLAVFWSAATTGTMTAERGWKRLGPTGSYIAMAGRPTAPLFKSSVYSETSESI